VPINGAALAERPAGGNFIQPPPHAVGGVVRSKHSLSILDALVRSYHSASSAQVHIPWLQLLGVKADKDRPLSRGCFLSNQGEGGSGVLVERYVPAPVLASPVNDSKAHWCLHHKPVAGRYLTLTSERHPDQ